MNELERSVERERAEARRKRTNVLRPYDKWVYVCVNL